MMKVTIAIIVLQTLLFSTSFQSRILTLLTDIKCSTNPEYQTCKAWFTYAKKNDPSTYLINLESDILQLGMPYMMSSVKLYKGPVGKKNECVKVMDMNVDLCKYFQKNNRGNPFTSYFIKFLKNYGQIATSCPLKVGHYYVHNLTLNGFGLPNFSGLFNGDADVMLRYRFVGKFKKVLVSMMNITAYGGYRVVK